MATTRALQNDLQEANVVTVSDQTIKNRLHEGNMTAWCSVVHWVAPKSFFGNCHRQVLHSHAVLYADESRLNQSTCSRQVWRCGGEHYKQFGGGSVMVWGRKSMERCTDLYRLDNSTWAAVRYWDGILGAIVRTHTVCVQNQHEETEGWNEYFFYLHGTGCLFIF